jgi:hypothetical protein
MLVFVIRIVCDSYYVGVGHRPPGGLVANPHPQHLAGSGRSHYTRFGNARSIVCRLWATR